MRQQKGLSLLDVEAASTKEFKASVLGAYERGERAMSVGRLARLADIYGVPVAAMLPREQPSEAPVRDAGIAIDISRLQDVDTPEGRVLWRYAQTLQNERGDWGGRVMTIRRDDLRALASVLEVTVTDLVRRIEDLGVRTG